MEIPRYIFKLENPLEREEGPIIGYCFHILAESSLYSAFCYFSILWLELLRFSTKAINIASLISTSGSAFYFISSFVLIGSLVSNPDADMNILVPYRIMFWVIIISLLITSLVFLAYGVYLQVVLHSWYSTNTGWQRAVLVKVNLIVLSCTFSCLLRITMIFLLWCENNGMTSWKFFTGDDDHPIVWTILSQIIPNILLASVLFYMSRPSPALPSGQNAGADLLSADSVRQPVNENTFTTGWPREDLLSSLISPTPSPSVNSRRLPDIGLGHRPRHDSISQSAGSVCSSSLGSMDNFDAAVESDYGFTHADLIS